MRNTKQTSPFEREILRVDKQLKKVQESMEAMKQKFYAGDIETA